MMAQMRTVARREIRGFVDHPAAYVLAVAFLGISLFLTFRSVYAMGVASLRPFFDLLPILLAVFVPAATMRSLAEERRGRTLEWLLAQPLDEVQVVVGKFLGNWLFVLLVIAGTLPTALGILLVSEADVGIIVAQYIGAALLAGQLVAIGLFASSVTRNQITAFIVAAAVSFTLFLIGARVVQIGLPPLLSGALARLSLVSHFENVARGVVDLRDVLYFVSTAALFLMLAWAAVARERLSPHRPETGRLRFSVLLVALMVLVLNLLGSHVRGRLDLTRDSLFTLAEGTRGIFAGLDDLVQATLFVSAGLPPEVQLQLRDVRDLLADMRASSGGNFLVTEVDPDDDEEAAGRAASYGVGPIEFNVLRDDEYQIRRGYYGLVLTYAEESEVFPVIQRTDDLEFRLASAVAKMTAESRRRVTFLSGFGAKSPYEILGLQESLADRYDLQMRDIGGESPAVLTTDSTDVLVVAGATQALDSVAVAQVRAFVSAGGAALLLLDPVAISPQSPTPVPVASGLEPWLEERGVRSTGSLALDLASAERVSLGRRGFFDVIAPYPLWPLTMPSNEHIITRGLGSLLLGWGGVLEIADSTRATALWQTTQAGGEWPVGMPIMAQQEWNIAEEDLDTRVVAVALEAADEDVDGEGRIVLVADATLAEAEFIRLNPQNLTFLANAIDWLTQDESLIRIRSKDRTPPGLVFTSDATRSLLKWGNLVGVPALFAIVGLIRATGRRRRAEARWKEVVA